MPSLIIELLSEEIPSSMQLRAAKDLCCMVTTELKKSGLTYESAKPYVTPRRLSLVVRGIPDSSAPVVKKERGPRLGSAEKTIAGFLKRTGLTSIKEASVISDTGGDYYSACVSQQVLNAHEIIQKFLPEIIRTFPWPKSQRWGYGSLKWVRPLKSILAVFGPENKKELKVVSFELDGLISDNVTYGHRFLCPDAIPISYFGDYIEKLYQAKVILDHERRSNLILREALKLSGSKDLTLVRDDKLLEEVVGLVEWPVVMLGEFDRSFLSLPKEIIAAAIRIHQKCFVLNDSCMNELSNHFIIVANMETTDGGVEIVRGYNRVVNARLADARYFYETDLKSMDGFSKGTSILEQRLEKLRTSGVVFHSKLGTQYQRVERIVRLARHIAPIVGADIDQAVRAAFLAKADLVTEVVGEFPGLQGLMGGFYAFEESPVVADAIATHYKPLGPSDTVPREPAAITVAIADKLDTLVGFWLIDEKPTGSRDPYQLRRAALGIIRIVLENKIVLKLSDLIATHMSSFGCLADSKITDQLIDFVYGRLQIYLQTQNLVNSITDAVLSADRSSDILTVTNKAWDLKAFLDTDSGRDLLIWYKRADSILKAEERKSCEVYGTAVTVDDFLVDEEVALYRAVVASNQKIKNIQIYTCVLNELAKLRGYVDRFFQAVLVNSSNPSIRVNRLRLLSALCDTCRSVANFSKLSK